MKKFQCSAIPQLSPFIDRIWGWQAVEGEVLQMPTLLPGTGAELYFHYGEPFQYTIGDGGEKKAGHGHLFCVRQNKIQLSSSANIGFIAVRFKVGMIHRFTAIPGAELVDEILCTSDIWGTLGGELLRHLSYAEDMQTRLSLIQSFLLRKLSDTSTDLLAEKTMAFIYKESSTVDIQSLADYFCLGRRQLERRIMKLAGQSPNDIKCLSRFQRTVRSAILDVAENPAALALSNGYYDQAHFIHDFQKRVGSTPHQYLTEARNKTHFYNTTVRR